MKSLKSILPHFVLGLMFSISLIGCNVAERAVALQSSASDLNGAGLKKVSAMPGLSAEGLKKAAAAQALHNAELFAIDGVTGTGVGADSTGAPAVVVLVEKEGTKGIPKLLEGIPVKVIISGRIEAFPGTLATSVGNGKGNSNPTAVGKLPPPSNLSYSNNPAVYTVGIAIPANFPTVTGSVSGWSVSPALPAGLSFNTITGVISGTPSASVTAVNYTVTAKNKTGSISLAVNITVNPALKPPSNLSYSSNPAVYTTGAAIADNTPAVTGTVASWSVSPSLPAGLSFNTGTGVLSGTPAVPATATNYTVTAANAAGSVSVAVSITVNAALKPPSNLTYSENPAIYTVDAPIPDNTPSVMGAVAEYWVDPPLPAGLTIHPITGVISGTPATATPVANYTVTAANAAGNTLTSLSIGVNAALQPPSHLSYSENPASYTVGTAITNNQPDVTGMVTSYSVSPALPAGLTFNTSTGVISGTPATATPIANYIVTAANAAGNTLTAISLAVNAALQPPSNLSYSENPATYTAGTAITNNEPGVTGMVTAYSVTPALPAGLTLNSGTGVISGTPAAYSPAVNYTMTASNAAGSATAFVSLAVNAAPILPPICELVNPISRFARPVPIGVSTGHPFITAGTIGARVKNAAGQLFALSNNHIYAASNTAALNDYVLQPGKYDGGVLPSDTIGRLAAFEAIKFCDVSGTCPANFIDAAIVSTTPDLVGNSTPCNGYGTPSKTTVAPAVGLSVTKYGRSTGMTSGTIAAVNVSLKVSYGTGQTALFKGQVYISTAGFCQGGDSGSLIVTTDGSNPVALLFAGSGTATVGNPIDSVLTHLGVTVDGM